MRVEDGLDATRKEVGAPEASQCAMCEPDYCSKRTEQASPLDVTPHGSRVRGLLQGWMPHPRSQPDTPALQDYLADEEFAGVLGMPRAAFAALPQWKRAAAKKKVGLF